MELLVVALHLSVSAADERVVRVYELRDASGRVFAFEVDASGRRGVTAVARAIPGTRVTKAPRFLSWFREEVFCEFELGGVKFEIWEPFGDNSRYWIGPSDHQWHPETQAVITAFASPGTSTHRVPP